MPEKIFMTSQGLEELKKELAFLKTVRRAEIAEKIKIARDFGDLSENSEYDEAKNEQAMVEANITRLEEQLRKVKILDQTGITGDVVALGTTVTIMDLDFNEQMTYQIVTSIEANHTQNETISDESPVGKALLGHKVGDEVIANLPNGSHATFKVLEIKA